MKVLIADDEVKVCQLIRHLVDWDEMGMEIVDIVNDGKSAYESICKNHPNIVITDIRMPNYDGIELIRRSKEVFSDIYFIIISGYSQFEYAQKAIKYGVEDYLLKPLKKKELESNLKKIKERYESLVSENIEKTELRQIASTSKEQIKENFLLKIASSELTKMNMEDVNAQYQCQFLEGYFTAFIIRPFFKEKAIGNESKEFLLTKIHQLVKEKCEQFCLEIIVAINGDELICLINMATSDLSPIEKSIKKIKLRITSLSEIFKDTKLVIGFGNSVLEFSQIPESVRQAEISVVNRIGEDYEYIIFYSDYALSGKKVADFIDISRRNAILASQERMDVLKIVEIIREIQEQLKEYKKDGKLVSDCFCELVECLQFGTKNYGEDFKASLLEDYKNEYRKFLKYEDIFNWIIAEIQDAYQEFESKKKIADSRPIKDAKQYIYDNYNINLTLENVSERIGFNPAYFSTLFKKETGKNFSEYIMELRITNAKTYLIQTNLDVAEIANIVGYSDLKYFSKLFKKETGLNPTEFRKLYGR